ncbi:MAG: virulence protein E [Prevotella sp.]|nr:virulence protein E [Prevotella sp.]
MDVSVFRNFWDKEPRSSTLEAMVEAIQSDERTRELTAGYRRQRLDALKNESMLFAVPCIFEGGKAQKHVVRLTGMSMVDFDHVSLTPGPSFPSKARLPVAFPKGEGSNYIGLKQKIISDPHTLLCYTTISGEGLRVLYRYELDESFELKQQIQFYKKAFAVGNAYYERLIGAKADGQCKNVTRLSVVAHDDEVYFNPEAEAFTAAWIDEQWEQMQQPMKENRKRSRELARIRALYAKTIKPEVEGEGAVYAPGSHNDYVMRVGYRLNQFGFTLETATEWAVSEFADYDKTASVIASCYEKSEEHGSRGGQKHSHGQDTGQNGLASVEEIEAFLKEHVKLRRNVITSRTEYLDEAVWRPISDTKVNSLWKDMSKTKRVNVQDVYRIIESDFVAEFHPFREYLESLTSNPSPKGEGNIKCAGSDFIRELAETVRVKGGPGEQELFYLYLKKWLVAMVAGWVDESVVNNVILVLIGEQGSYKTTWFNYLLPPELKQYFYTKTNSNRMTKDDLLTLAQYGLVCCEELDTMSPRDLNQLKAAVTMPSIDERAAYAHYHEHRGHIASFCGTGNNVQFLSDPTGNRRWLPFEIEQIRNPREHPFNYEGIYSQAYRLYREGFQFWFDQDEIKRLSRHNEHYETPKQERELVDVYFRKPRELEGGEFMPVSRAMQIVGGNTVQTLSDVRLGRAFRDLGFVCKRNSQGRGYIVVCRTTEEIKARQRMLAASDDDAGEEAMPF